MKSVNKDKWFWHPERLAQLLEVMKAAAERQGSAWYFGPEGVVSAVWAKSQELGCGWPRTKVAYGVRMMVYFGILDPGSPGVKQADYRRWFYPEARVTLDWAAINWWRQHVQEVAQGDWIEE